MKTVAEIQRRIFELRGGGSKFSIEPMREFARELGEPQNAFNSVPIAGTNGTG